MKYDERIAPKMKGMAMQPTDVRPGFALAPNMGAIMVGGLCCIASIYFASKTVASWIVVSPNPNAPSDIIELILGILVAVFFSFLGAFLLGIVRQQMLEDPSGSPIKGHNVLLGVMFLCGLSGCVSITGILVSWFVADGVSP